MILNCTRIVQGGSSNGCAAFFFKGNGFSCSGRQHGNHPCSQGYYVFRIDTDNSSYLSLRSLVKNKKVIFFCDNEAVVFILNNKSAKSERVMTLLRFVVYWTLKSNIQLKAKHIFSFFNKIADYISRVQVEQFRKLAPSAYRCPCRIPVEFLSLCGRSK